jgi:hypothetical protein
VINFKPIKYTIGLIAGQRLIIVIISVCLTTALFVGCRSNTAAPDNSPAFSNMAHMGGKPYAAYASPDVLNVPDTIKMSFNYNSAKVKSIDVRATLDSAKTWIPLGIIAPDVSNSAEIRWVPGDDSALATYCGQKKGFIRVRDSISNEYSDSDPFILLGDCPAFSDMSRLGDKLYVAYKSPDVLEKSDTVKISFHYNYTKVKSIDVSATLDSAKTWIPLSTLTPSASDQAAVSWVPRSDPVSFAYFGKKTAYVRVSGGNSGEHIESDSFIICGKVPYVLISPQRKESFPLSDTIPIMYSQNQDLSSNISIGFLLGTDSGYVNISDKNETIKVSASLPIKVFVTKFVPLDFAAKAKNYTDPITIFIADYGGASAILKADSISIH